MFRHFSKCEEHARERQAIMTLLLSHLLMVFLVPSARTLTTHSRTWCSFAVSTTSLALCFASHRAVATTNPKTIGKYAFSLILFGRQLSWWPLNVPTIRLFTFLHGISLHANGHFGRVKQTQKKTYIIGHCVWPLNAKNVVAWKQIMIWLKKTREETDAFTTRPFFVGILAGILGLW